MDVKQTREKLGLSQEALAKNLGVSSRTVQNWEKGQTMPYAMQLAMEALEAKQTQPRPIEVTQTATGTHATQIAGDHTHVGGCASLDKALDEIAAQRRLVENAQEQTGIALAQVNRLITLLENKLSNG